jgi:hypothetical protein
LEKRTKLIIGGVVVAVLAAVAVYMNLGGGEKVDPAAAEANAKVAAEIADKTPPQPEMPQHVVPPGTRGSR